MKNPLCDELLLYQPTDTEVEDLHSSYIVNCVLNAFLSITAIILNIVTIQALRKTSSLPKPLKTLLLSLAVSDLGVGLLCHPLCIALLVEWMKQNAASNSNCALYTTFVFSMGLFSVPTFFGVTALSVDRFLAIHLHLRYQELVTHKRVVAAVISIWVFSSFFSLIRLWIPRNIFFAIFICIAIVCLLTTTLLYFKIYLAARRHKEQIEALQVQQVAEPGDMANVASVSKSAVGTFYVYLVFLVCYLPQSGRFVALIVAGSTTATKGFSLFSWTLIFLNSSLNPVIYCWKMRHIRHAIMDILRNILPIRS
ncbi:melanocyte-stimulating hormone receptor-like [Oculina patagonica]